jgi:putative DNA primase/helicase
MAELTIRALLKEAANADDENTTKWAVKCNKSARARTEMLEVAKHRRAVRIDQFDRNPWLLGVENGVVDLRTGDLLPHRRDDMVSALCPTTYGPDASCPRWEQFLLEIMDGDAAMTACLQRMAGYFLTGDISVQILPIFYGPGGNGKNVFLDTIMGIMGSHAAEAPEGLLTARITDEHPTEIADLYGKRLVVASESEEGRKMRIGLVKKITGNRYLKARFMRQDYFQFERTHKTVLVTNNKPIVTETSNAVWRRLRLIPFTVTIPEEKQDRHLTERLVAEWPGILAWAVRGCLDWQKRQCDLALPDAVRDATTQYRSDSDAVGDFLQERCIVAGDLKVSRSSLYQAFVEWAKGGGEEMLSGKAFASRMRSRGFNDSAWTTEHARRLRAWTGVALVGPVQEGGNASE